MLVISLFACLVFSDLCSFEFMTQSENLINFTFIEAASLEKDSNEERRKRDRYFWGISSAGRAPALHAGGQRFDPAILHHF